MNLPDSYNGSTVLHCGRAAPASHKGWMLLYPTPLPSRPHTAPSPSCPPMTHQTPSPPPLLLAHSLFKTPTMDPRSHSCASQAIPNTAPVGIRHPGPCWGWGCSAAQTGGISCRPSARARCQSRGQPGIPTRCSTGEQLPGQVLRGLLGSDPKQVHPTEPWGYSRPFLLLPPFQCFMGLGCVCAALRASIQQCLGKRVP